MTELPWTKDEMLTLAARGLGRVDLLGPRGATMVTAEEVAAMAGLLALCGLKPIYPGTYTPASDIPHSEGHKT